MRNDKLLALGFSSALTTKILNKKQTISGLRSNSCAALMEQGFTLEEAEQIREKVNRSPIPKETVAQLIGHCGGCCCYCVDGNQDSPFQIHHINDYANSHDHGLDNLLLVCPTHHVWIHTTKVTAKEQCEARNSWVNLWAIATEYKSKGVLFPFGAFEYVDYDVPGQITDIFNFGPAKPQVCGQLFKGSLLDTAVNMLNHDHKILITAASGSGKTTFSFATGAMLKGFSVYRYSVGEKGSLETRNEILRFLGIVSKPILLIIDDASTMLVGGDTEKILALASASKKLIIINTKADLSATDELEQRVARSVLPITWSAIQSTVKTNLLAHEQEVLSFLKEKDLNHFKGERIGYAFTDKKLGQVLDAYAQGTTTVWQFIFMLASGTQLLDRRLLELRDRDRLDLLVIYLGINQIATFEQGASVQDILDFFKVHPHFKDQSQPGADWVKFVLEQLSKQRLIKKNRDRYNLVHRMLALNLLELNYIRDKANIDAILDVYFLSNKPIRQTIILWTWLRGTLLSQYVSAWKNSRTLEDWTIIADKAMEDGLTWISIIVDTLHPSNPGILNHILKDRGKSIAKLINANERDTMDYLRRLSMAIKYNAPEIWPELLENIDKQQFYEMIRDAHPWEFEGLRWTFHSIRDAQHQSWILDLSEKFTLQDFHKIASRIGKGDIRALSDLISFWRQYVENLTVREFAELMAYLPKLLHGAKISEIHFPFYNEGYSEILAFPDLMDDVFAALDPEKLASEFVELTPDHWGNLLILTSLADSFRNPVIVEFLAKVDLTILMRNIEYYYLDDLYHFRLMIHQLASVRRRKKAFAKLLQPLVATAMTKAHPNGASEHQSILYAFSRIDKKWVEQYCQQAQISLEEHRREMKEENDHDSKAISYRINQLNTEQLDGPLYDIRIKIAETN